MKILFINACVRKNSRTLLLAKRELEKFDAEENEIIEINLENEGLSPLNREALSRRDELLAEGAYDAPMLRYATEFASADKIVIAAPFWDLSFPALLKIYFEQITVVGVTFEYQNGIPRGLCRADELIYVTTAGGPIFEDYGYSYARALARNFYGIARTKSVRAANLDVLGITAENLFKDAEISVVE